MIHIPIAASSALPEAAPAMTNARWVEYFEANANRETRLPFDLPVTLSPAVRAPLVRTLQRFHLGESGEGTYLKRWAKACGDADYCRAIDLFVAEEQTHSRWFGLLLERLETPPLKGHWSDVAFTIVRRMGGLHFELMTFLVAEVIGKRFFAALGSNICCPLASAIFQQVVRDEAAHITFHIGTLQRAFARQTPLQRRFSLAVWRGVLHIALGILCHDHATLLRQLRISRRQLKQDCWWLFEDIARRVYAPAQSPIALHMSNKDKNVILEMLRSTQVRKEATPGSRPSTVVGRK